MVAKKLFLVAVLVSFGFLSFVAGMAVFELEIWPYAFFRDGYRAAKAWHMRLMPTDRDASGLYVKGRYTHSGVLRYDRDKAYNGLTLFTSTHAQKAYLINMEGQIVHEWYLPFSQVWENPPHIAWPLSSDFILWRKAHLYPNGDLLALYIASGDTPWGYGLVKMDKDSKMIWKYAEHVHHDIEVGSDGKIYTLINEFVTEKIPELKQLEPPFLEDSIVVLSPDGQELKRVSIPQAFRNSEFTNVLEKMRRSKWDPSHANNVEVLDEQMAAQFPFLKKGQVLISMRNVDTLAAVDLDEEKVVWATRGMWMQQHDPDFLPNGNMLVFDNIGYYGAGKPSRIIEFNPQTMEVVWQYTGDKENPFFSGAKSAQQRLPNGNTLITESYQGRTFEITKNKEIVWEFVIPFRSARDKELIAQIHWAQRFHPDDLHFEFSKPNQ